ncbi:M23 family metallopeptidase [Prolixibacter sp. NT017]|uniref:M23 family metallopeptidase n=1 Tax=Prolixibacter sp. NT017 TaxID=2652390 RepID=UPI001288252C|nr:M23 family metallopeptidase [Prolixibacter sp. NT017]GET27409.1 peptidase M23 [Prolixibacter sp. NT017]
MITENQKKRLRYKMKNPLRMVIFNDQNLHTVGQFRFTPQSLFMLIASVVILLIVAVILLIAFTPLREYIPGYPTGEMRQTIVQNALMVDSLESELAVRDRYFRDIRMLLAGETPPDETTSPDTIVRLDQIHFKKYDHDSLFQDQLSREQFNLSLNNQTPDRKRGISELLFFPPINGVITNHFDAASGHFGVDVVAKKNTRISSVLDGTVVFTGWTMQTGYVIEIQHEHNLVTFYKHNSELLKKAGDKVKAGEAIAIMGNTGMETTGPHLHFEMWQSGVPLNPEDYINF